MDYRSFEAPSGERLDVAISEWLKASRTYAKNLISDGFVQINGKPVDKPSHKLKGAEIITVLLPPPRPMRVEGEDIPLEIIYEDTELIAINKPPNLITHPTSTVRTGTVVNALLGKHKLSREGDFESTTEDYRPGIVHRLDKDTSGVMVVAKNDEAHRQLSAAFKKRLTEKEYIAIAVGKLDDDIHLNAPIGRHPIQRQKMSVGGESARPANTYFRVLARIPGYSLVKAKPHTGRTHQIRVHLAHLSASILGDEVYGKGSSVIDRQALHAHRLTLPHPKTNEAISFVAHIPIDMVEAWLKLGGSWPPPGVEEL
ncbi:MAG: RluA family pseudouridine synthase [Trueperaceae bacterium]